MKTIRIGERLVGDGQPCYIVAEAGVNHNGQLDLAKRLVAIAVRAGADAVKFQKRSIPAILIRQALDAPYLEPHSRGATYGEHRERLELSEEAYRELVDLCGKDGITFLASAWDLEAADFVEELGVPVFKIASADLTNVPLVEHIARKRKPIIMSTGMSELEEIADAVNTVFRHHQELILLHCTSAYPSEYFDLNLRAMETLRREFGCLVGYSGHERGLATTYAARTLGACVVERHFTLDRSLPGPDHAASLEPRGLELLVRDIRHIETALGSPQKRLLSSEIPVRRRLAKSVAAARDIPAGRTITRDDLTVKGPGTGISPRYLSKLDGVVAQHDIPADTLIPPEALEWR
ncbi:MAG: N-acetylneuraminate synthase family protein [Candidatus Methylomirabilales bacterium]